ncbi:heme-binding protein [Labrenzia sp. 011]|uniref:GlcG/HbpS family heme-binding protein n=1 Tax=Labrenzia sp. 011 TaxID=2171494 RepID=UPI000D51800E|nr:heme-binding protein [Labrenzia sp. 011]PVB59676.1 GlcG protein [Labrenzia sp. 011]
MRLASSLSLTIAETIVEAVLATGRREQMKPLTVAVLDSGGRLVAMKSEDGSGLMRFDIAFGKAWGSLGMGLPSRTIRDYLSARPAFQNALSVASEGRFIPVPGGVLIEDGEGRTIGAVGVSGDTSEKDEYCAILAIRDAGLAPLPADHDPDWQASSLSDRH